MKLNYFTIEDGRNHWRILKKEVNDFMATVEVVDVKYLIHLALEIVAVGHN